MKIMKLYLIFLFYFISTDFLYPQDKPAFQQSVDHRIEVKLDDVNHVLHAEEWIIYKNNSPDTLQFIFFHLWPNAYSSDRTAYNMQSVENGDIDFYIADRDSDWGKIDSLSFTVQGESAPIVPTAHQDIVKLILPQPLFPGQEIAIYTPFRVQLPKVFSRMGHEGNSYVITQWYPKPAVYDNEGWHEMSYLDQGEFYSEFGNYDVKITLPKNYVVMATGDFQDESEIAFLNQIASYEMTENQKKNQETPASSTELKTIQFKQEQVHDFAWFADKRWRVKISQFKVKESEKNITAYAAFYPWHENGWKNSLQYIINTVNEYSKRVGPYQYNTVKVVESPMPLGGGMEYPSITNIKPTNYAEDVEELIIHEVGHNWFYGMLANNERINPWLDESINTFYHNKVKKAIGNNNKSQNNLIGKLAAAHVQKGGMSVPISKPAHEFPFINYGIDVYNRGAHYFEWLQDYMDSNQFETAMKSYFTTYKLRHVHPEDFEFIFRKHSNRNLDWFFNDALHSAEKIDFRIINIRNEGHNTIFTVRNQSKIKIPAVIEYETVDENNQKITRKVATEPFLNVTSIQIDNNGYSITEATIAQSVPDVVIRNNYFKNGRSNHFRIQPLVGHAWNYNTSLYVLPAIGYNYYDRFMLGVALHNLTVPAHDFQFALVPMYGFGNKHITGTGFLALRQYLNTVIIHNIQYKLEGKSFGLEKANLNSTRFMVSRYIKLAPEISFTLSKPYYRSPIERQLSIKGYFISEQPINYLQDGSDSIFRPHLGHYQNHVYARVLYDHKSKTTFNPFGYSVEGQIGKQFGKLMAESELRVDYRTNKKSFYIRGFIGKYFNLSNDGSPNSRYYLTSTYSGINDYLYDETFIARQINFGFWSHQISVREGGMKIPTLMYANKLGISNNWLGAINLRSDLPFGNLPIQIFADLSTYSNAKNSNPSGAPLLYDAGIMLGQHDVFAIYIPLLYSKDYKDYLTSIYGKNTLWHGITFQMNFNVIDWTAPFKDLKRFY